MKQAPPSPKIKFLFEFLAHGFVCVFRFLSTQKEGKPVEKMNSEHTAQFTNLQLIVVIIQNSQMFVNFILIVEFQRFCQNRFQGFLQNNKIRLIKAKIMQKQEQLKISKLPHCRKNAPYLSK